MSWAADPEDLMDSQADASPAPWATADTGDKPNAAIADIVERKRDCFIVETPPAPDIGTGAIGTRLDNWTKV